MSKGESGKSDALRAMREAQAKSPRVRPVPQTGLGGGWEKALNGGLKGSNPPNENEPDKPAKPVSRGKNPAKVSKGSSGKKLLDGAPVSELGSLPKRGRGRPSSPNSRTVPMTILLSPQERAELEARAAGKPLSTWARDVLLEKRTKP